MIEEETLYEVTVLRCTRDNPTYYIDEDETEVWRSRKELRMLKLVDRGDEYLSHEGHNRVTLYNKEDLRWLINDQDTSQMKRNVDDVSAGELFLEGGRKVKAALCAAIKNIKLRSIWTTLTRPLSLLIEAVVALTTIGGWIVSNWSWLSVEFYALTATMW